VLTLPNLFLYIYKKKDRLYIRLFFCQPLYSSLWCVASSSARQTRETLPWRARARNECRFSHFTWWKDPCAVNYTHTHTESCT